MIVKISYSGQFSNACNQLETQEVMTFITKKTDSCQQGSVLALQVLFFYNIRNQDVVFSQHVPVDTPAKKNR